MSAWSMMLMRFLQLVSERTKKKNTLPARALFFFREFFAKKKRGRVEGGFTFENARALLFTNKQFSVRDFIDNEAKRAWE